MSRFKQAVQEGKEFVITCEHVPGRGLTGKRMDSILQFAEDAAGSELIHGLAIMAVDGHEAVFINILGEISPDELSMVMNGIDLDLDVDLDI